MILCLESSADPTVIGLVDKAGLITERVFSNRDRLADTVAEILQSTTSVPKEITQIAIGIGPGSFTGLRVSLAFAKGMARALDIPIWPVSSLRVIAASLQCHWDAVAVISPARRGQAHFAIFGGEEMLQVGESRVLPYEEVITHLSTDMALVGPGVIKLNDEMRKQLNGYIPFADDLHRPHSEHLARLARFEWEEKDPPDISTLTPVYGLDFPV
jgi:tRNA threonylcarbamoyladenosine biosynthesis protein TsaB